MKNLKKEIENYEKLVDLILDAQEDTDCFLSISVYDAGILDFCDFFVNTYPKNSFSLENLIDLSRKVYYKSEELDEFLDCDEFDYTLREYLKKYSMTSFQKLVRDTDVDKFMKFYFELNSEEN